MLKFKYVVRAFDAFDNFTLGYRLFADENAAKACARRYRDRERWGDEYAVYPLTCTLHYGLDYGEGSECRFGTVEEHGSFSEMARRFDEIVKDSTVVYAEIEPWFDNHDVVISRYSYVKPVE